MSGKLELHSTQRFNGDLLEYYLDTENGDLWVTREQIGSFLDYKHPQAAIAQIHTKHFERLDKFSGRINVQYKNGGNHNVIAYSFKGLLEICRWSRQPNADTILDNLWEFYAVIESNSNQCV